jgi:hypothetical protein
MTLAGRMTRITLIGLGALMALFCACATVNQAGPQSSLSAQTPQEQAQQIEPMLDTAGFQSLPASTPEQKSRLKALPAMKLGYYTDQHGAANYWLSDPDYCGCLFHGDEAAYQRYQVLQKDNQTAENDRQALQAQRYQQPFSPWGAGGGFGPGPGLGFSFGPGGGFMGGGFGFSL